MSSNLASKPRRTFTLGTFALLLLLITVACNGRGCNRAETCDECVKRCVDTQGVSPDVCRAAACSRVCQSN